MQNSTLDLRRAPRRDQIERLIDGAQHLPAEQALLLRAVYEDGRAVKDVAVMTGVPPRTLSRHVRQLAARVLSRQFQFVLVHIHSWPATRRRVAVSCMLHGRSLREASTDLGLSLYTVRHHREAINAIYQQSVA